MAKTPEGLVKEKITKLLKEYEVYYFFPPANGYGRSGGFDICCSYKGHFIGIEVKANKLKKPTALQTKNAELAFTIGGASSLLIHNGNLYELENLIIKIRGGGNARIEGVQVWPINSNRTDNKST